MREGCHTACVLGCSLLLLSSEWRRWGWVSRAEGRGLTPGAGQDVGSGSGSGSGSHALHFHLRPDCLLTWPLLLSDLITAYKSKSLLSAVQPSLHSNGGRVSLGPILIKPGDQTGL